MKNVAEASFRNARRFNKRETLQVKNQLVRLADTRSKRDKSQINRKYNFQQAI